MTGSRKTSQQVTGKTKLYGLLGHGIGHSLSPAIHNAAFHILGIDATYVPFDTELKDIKACLTSLLELNLQGLNVTLPHKRRVAEALSAKQGSINTLFRKDEKWGCTSTDGIGFSRGLDRICDGLGSFNRIVILGSGGASEALCEFLSHAFKGAISVCRRTEKHDANILKVCKQARLFHWHADTIATEIADPKTLLVQATSAPLHGDSLDSLIPALHNFTGVFVDLVYGSTSALYSYALARNLKCQDGEAMLIEQARKAQEIWFGESASYTELAAAIRSR